MLQMCWGTQWRRMGSDMKPTGMYFDENGKPYLVANPSKRKRKKLLKQLKSSINPSKTQIFVIRNGEPVIMPRCRVVDFQIET